MNKLYNMLRRTRAHRAAELRESTTVGHPLPTPATVLPGVPNRPLRIAVLPDTQVRASVPTDHIAAYGKYIAAKQPDVIVCIGDFADMPSLSTYDRPGSLPTEGRRYCEDVDSVLRAMDSFVEPIAKATGYSPRMVLTLGNHEDRIDRALSRDPKRIGTMSLGDLKYADYGWTVIPFLRPVIIGGAAFCHYFPSGVMGKAISTAANVLRQQHMSCFAGHLQGRDVAYGRRGDGRSMSAIISGSFYQHDEGHLSPLTNQHWRGAWFLHEVQNGEFDEMALSVGYLLRKFK